jgi:hypothetical protein
MFFDPIKNAQNVDWSDYHGKDDVLAKEINKRESFTPIFVNNNNVESIKTNVDTLTYLNTQNNQLQTKLLSNYTDISYNVQSYLDIQRDISNNDTKYHYNDEMDPISIMKKDTGNNIHTILEKDINMLKLYQNSIYVSSAIACATLLIAAIIIIPLQKNS